MHYLISQLVLYRGITFLIYERHVHCAPLVIACSNGHYVLNLADAVL